MKKVKVVTGYIPIAGHPRSAAEYGALGEKFADVKGIKQPFYGVVTSCWLYHMIELMKFDPVWAVSDNPQKNTLAYHCVQHQKFQWLYDAMKMDDSTDTFVWIDYGIFHVPGVTAPIINDFLDRVARKRLNKVHVPGCWPIGLIPDDDPCWRFCGGVMVVPRELAQPLKNLVQAVTLLHANITRKISFEVNSLARAEQSGKVPFHWYKADHNEQLFTEF